MIRNEPELADLLRATILNSRGAVLFSDFIRDHPVDEDERLAELIEADGRARIEAGSDVELQEYLDAVPDLPHKPVALDAAIDMTLRSLSGTSAPREEAVRTLCENYPHLRAAILDAAVMGLSLWETSQPERERTSPYAGSLPCDFGPLLPSGEPQYELLRSLGAGATGEVFLARDRALSEADRPALVAVKVLAPHLLEGWARQRFIEEATKARRIDHPNVVRVLLRGVTPRNEEFIVYEYVPGGDLHQKVNSNGPLPVREAVRLVAQVARGVQAIHSSGLVHCDLKPGNILLSEDGTPKIADFGIAARVAAHRLDPASAGATPMGTLAFMAPEQFRMEPDALAPPADIYALGAVLFWTATGKLVHGKSVEDFELALSGAAANQAIPSLQPHAPGADGDLDSICAKALAMRSRDRYASPAAFADDLEAWLRLEPIPWTRPTPRRILKLAFRRRPYRSAIITVTVILATVAAAVVSHFVDQYCKAQTDLAFRAQRMNHGGEMFDSWAQSMTAAASASGVAGRQLTTVWLLEFIYGSTLFRNPAILGRLWHDRIVIAEQAIEAREMEGASDHLETHLWRVVLGYWHLQNGEWREAESVLCRAEEGLSRRLDPDDALLPVIRGLRAAAALEQISRSDFPLSQVSRQDLLGIERALYEGACASHRTADGNTIGPLLREHLIRLYEPGLLDSPAARTFWCAQQYPAAH